MSEASDNHSKTIISTRSPSEMSEAEKREERRQLRERLKILNATPRSDWHREFERLLRRDAKPYGADVEIRIEVELGIDPPRVDYLILDDKKRLMSHIKAIFRICRQHSIWDYKNPNDALNMRVISKIIGYGNFYIGLAEHDGDRPRSEVTLSIFRDSRNDELFKEMMEEGTLRATSVPGIYMVEKLTDLTFQIVIGNELVGDEYAAYRLLTNHAKEEDAEIVAKMLEDSNDPDEQEDGKKLFEIVEKMNPGITRKTMGGGRDKLASILMDVLKPEIDVVVKDAVDAAVNTAVADRHINDLFEYVQDGGMTISFAANKAGLTPQKFKTEMTAHGFKVPELV